MIIKNTHYSLLNKNKELVAPFVWDIKNAGGSLNNNNKSPTIMLESERDWDKDYDLLIMDDKWGESFVPTTSLRPDQKEIIKDYYDDFKII